MAQQGSDYASASRGDRQASYAKTSAYAIERSETGATFTNEGATGIVAFTLPAYQTGLVFSFYVEDEDGLSITSPDVNIRIISIQKQTVSCLTIGGYTTLKAMNGGWRSMSAGGSWS